MFRKQSFLTDHKVINALSNQEIDSNLDKILPGVFIGSLKVALLKDKLLQKGITHILCAIRDM